ncbi:MAG: DUF2309 domain-containing protein [Gammaproteobacteria bacterium]|nr:DUF2309 domain-containing protein [Gammaproteobacteria bacterium]
MNSAAAITTAMTQEYPASVTQVAQRIAPQWPLDQAIAVNPWWHWRAQPMSEVAATLAVLSDAHMLMPTQYYQKLWPQTITPEHLQAAVQSTNYQGNQDDLVAYLEQGALKIEHWHNFSELLDAEPQRRAKMKWRDEIVQQISQFCGLYFRYPEQIQTPEHDHSDLYRTWIDVARRDKGIEVLMGEQGLHDLLVDLPDCPKALCQRVIAELGDLPNFEHYLLALLQEVFGWASFMAYSAWQNVSNSKTNTLVEQLISIRLAWDFVLWQHSKKDPEYAALRDVFRQQFSAVDDAISAAKTLYEPLWVWQRALEISYQATLTQQLTHALSAPTPKTPHLQAVFCIDVRSEPMRRALEAQDPTIETLGFAGFFGLPIAYSANADQYRRAQLPGLLSASIEVSDDSELAQHKARLSNEDTHDNAFKHSAASFGLVEMFGLFKATKLLKRSLFPSKNQHPVNQTVGKGPFRLSQNGRAVALSEQAAIAAQVLKHMGLTNQFADTVLLLGHGSDTTNNPQAAALDCGACGGQTGEINVKVLAQMLNDVTIRAELQQHAISIPARTRFIAGLHNTTTDEITCYEAPSNPTIDAWLSAATTTAQQNRAASLGLEASPDLEQAYQSRTKDWAEIRPEWGLANNASFIVAPRSLTRPLNLQGRAFLHDYQWQNDAEFKTLELIMTAPMIVTNWINLQYYASTVDNRIYGSGNKLLHNVVGENIGVFEGNGGDLRIGLSMQSLHDGQHWRHTPVRLSVYIAAPKAAIESIITEHAVVAELLHNDWLMLFQLDQAKGTLAQYRGPQNWQTVSL